MDFKDLSFPNSNYIVKWKDSKGTKYLGFCQLSNARKHVKRLLNCCGVSGITVLNKSGSILGIYGD